MIYEFLLEQLFTNFARAMIVWAFGEVIYIYIYTGRAGRPPSLGGISLHIIIVIIVVEPVPALTSKNHQSGLVSVSKIRIAIESDFWNRDQNLVFINDRMNLFCVGSYQNCNTILIFYFFKI
jgi:hypothetical protein